MKVAEMHLFEDERIERLRHLEVLDTDREAVFDGIVELVSIICHTPISLVSLVDTNRQWFKAAVGLEAKETARDIAFCSHAILNPEPLIVEDVLKDARFHDNPLVTGDPRIRFYAGSPLVTSAGLPVGTLCAIDRVPRVLTEGQRRALVILSNQVVAHLEMRELLASLKKTAAAHVEETASTHRWLATLSHDLRAPLGSIIGIAELVLEDLDVMAREEVVLHLAELRNAARVGYQLLENILDLSLLKGGLIQLSPAPIHLDSLLARVRSVVIGMATRKGIHVQIGGSEALTLLADPRLAMSIFQNLVSNAVKFTKLNGTVVILYGREGGDVVVRIRDGGVGLDQATLDQLNAGEIVGSAKGTAGETGSGWGLRLCREFCKLCDASLSFEAHPGGGTTCTVRFRSTRPA